MRRFTLFICFMTGLLCFMFSGEASANNIAVSNVSITGQSTSAQTAKVQFDISWENSWRNYINYDAAWVFIKYSTDHGTTWNHATLKTTGFSTGSGTVIDIVVPTDLRGAFLRRSSNGSGTLSTTSVQLVWGWGADGLTSSSSAQVKVFAIEMVYIPTGAFSLGDGSVTNVRGQFCSGTTFITPFSVTSEGAITLGGGSAGSLGNNNASGMKSDAPTDYDDFNNSTSQSLLAAYPKGYNAFYIMKYELSQGQYRDFLNTLTRAQQNTRTASQVADQYVMSDSATLLGRNGIRAPSSIPSGVITFGCDLNGNKVFNESTDGEWIACNYLTWMDLAAYAGWSGLRPMTELEFEKACRGPSTPVANEYAWGTTDLNQVTSINNSGHNNETAGQTGNGLCNYNNGVGGPLRSGFAATTTTSRLTAGASYWGVMDLTGNNWERCVTVGNSSGRAFQGTHGTGALSANGNATNIVGKRDWPGYTSEVVGAAGSAFRGGDWGLDTPYLRTSDRYYGAYGDSSRFDSAGIRCVRTAS